MAVKALLKRVAKRWRSASGKVENSWSAACNCLKAETSSKALIIALAQELFGVLGERNNMHQMGRVTWGSGNHKLLL